MAVDTDMVGEGMDMIMEVAMEGTMDTDIMAPTLRAEVTSLYLTTVIQAVIIVIQVIVAVMMTILTVPHHLLAHSTNIQNDPEYTQ